MRCASLHAGVAEARRWGRVAGYRYRGSANATVVGAGLTIINARVQRQQTPTNQGTTLGAATGATARGRTEFPQLAALWPREWPGETSNDRRKRKINGGSSWPRPARAGRGGTCAVRREREKREYELPRFGGTVGTCLGEREREQRAVEVLAATRTHSLFPSLPPRTAPQCTPSWCWVCGSGGLQS